MNVFISVNTSDLKKQKEELLKKLNAINKKIERMEKKNLSAKKRQHKDQIEMLTSLAIPSDKKAEFKKLSKEVVDTLKGYKYQAGVDFVLAKNAGKTRAQQRQAYTYKQREKTLLKFLSEIAKAKGIRAAPVALQAWYSYLLGSKLAAANEAFKDGVADAKAKLSTKDK